jgi:hypothetical protein
MEGSNTLNHMITVTVPVKVTLSYRSYIITLNAKKEDTGFFSNCINYLTSRKEN